MEKKFTTHITKGFIAVAIMITFDIVSYFLHFKDQVWTVPVLGCILLGSVIWGCILYGRQAISPVTFGSAFTHGFKMTAVITCIFFVYTLLAVNVLFSANVDQMVQHTIEEIKKRPDYSEEKMRANIGMARTVIKAAIFAGTVLATLTVGVIGALIGSVVAQNYSRGSIENSNI